MQFFASALVAVVALSSGLLPAQAKVPNKVSVHRICAYELRVLMR